MTTLDWWGLGLAAFTTGAATWALAHPDAAIHAWSFVLISAKVSLVLIGFSSL